jgi:1,4-alpha-glucan branching enzyme
VSRLTGDDLHLFNEGRHFRMWERFGAHLADQDGIAGCRFAVWAPNARSVDVVGSFNDWTAGSCVLSPSGSSGVWEGWCPGVLDGQLYKYRIVQEDGRVVDKADPLARCTEVPPRTASVICADTFAWSDGTWMDERDGRNGLAAPISTYELHAGSWERAADGSSLSWLELADRLPDYLEAHGFTHLELMPVMEHPFFGSWGYQVTGFFAPSARYGRPEDLKELIDRLHARGIGVILDWVPSHFPADEFALARFDGTHLYEHQDPRLGLHPDWDSLIFNYGRHEVRSFLISSALYWLTEFHADGLRVDAVASMLYLDYSRAEGEWVPNPQGGRENLEAVEFLQQLNQEAYRAFPGILMIAEESTAWPGVTRPVSDGGLGFGLKWDMGWMHDMLDYMARDPIHRRFHHSDLTFRQLYAFTENFVLALSHDEVVHGKGSLLGRMAGTDRERFANLRLLLASMIAQPGKKLLFMGGEFGQPAEWDHDGALDWIAAKTDAHRGVGQWLADLNRLYTREPAMHELDCDAGGFEWVAPDDHLQNVISFMRRSRNGHRAVLCVLNFAPVLRTDYRVGVPLGGGWRELLNSDAQPYGGSGEGNLGRVQATDVPFHGAPQSICLTLPPLAALFLAPEAQT